jgi:hypothetical protein
MLDISEIAKASRDLIKQLTNIVGLIEKNLASYDRIKARFQRKRMAARLHEILKRITLIGLSTNRYTLWMLTEHAVQKGIDAEEFVRSVESDKICHYDLRDYLGGLLELRDFVDQYRGDLISIDYRLYEALQEAILGRIDVLKVLTDQDASTISAEKLKELYESYLSLVKAITDLKDTIQSAARSVSQGKAVRVSRRPRPVSRPSKGVVKKRVRQT